MLDVYGSDLYWVTREGQEVWKMDKFARGVNSTVRAGVFNARDVLMFHSQRYNTSSE